MRRFRMLCPVWPPAIRLRYNPLQHRVSGRYHMRPIPLITPFTAGVRTLRMPNVSSSSRDLALAALCFMRSAFVITRFPRRFIRVPSNFRPVSGFYPGPCLGSADVLGAALPPRADFSVVDTFPCSRMKSEKMYSPRFGSHVFHGGGAPSTVAARNDFVFLSRITTNQCCWQTCTVSI